MTKTPATILLVCGLVGAALLLGLAVGRAAAPVNGGFTVNSDLDTNVRDQFLTLREAILIANGDLIGPFSTDERNQLGGCQFNDQGQITGGCGDQLPDEIGFDRSLTIILTEELPPIGDRATTIVANAGQVVAVSGGDQFGPVLAVSGSDTQIEGLRVYGAGPGAAQISIEAGAHNVILAHNVIGDDDPASGGCGQSPSAGAGIQISDDDSLPAGEVRAWVYGNVIECVAGAPGHGILVAGDGVRIGEDETGRSGSGSGTANLIRFNAGDGVVFENGVANGVLRSSKVEANGGDGVSMENTSGMVVRENFLLSNSGNGLRMTAVVSHTVGVINDQANSNYIDGNLGYGVVISASRAITIGAETITNNGLDGIRLLSTENTQVRAAEITNNGGTGVTVMGASRGNDIKVGEVWGNRGLPYDLGVDGPDGHTPNDSGDADAGPNALLNYPVVTYTTENSMGGIVCPSCFVDIYEAVGNPALPGGGGIYVSSVEADEEGTWNDNFTLQVFGLSPEDVTLATVDTDGNTSEMRPRGPQAFLPAVLR